MLLFRCSLDHCDARLAVADVAEDSAGASGNSTSSNAAKDAMTSAWVTSASLTLGLIFAGQRTMKGTRVPPSQTWYLPPRGGP